MGTAIGLGPLVCERGETFVGVAHEPAMNRPAVDPVAGGDVFDGGTVEHLSDRVVALLTIESSTSMTRSGSGEHKCRTASGLEWWNWWDTGAGTTVAQEPEPGSASGTEVPEPCATEVPDFHNSDVGFLLDLAPC
jgi:hypothetical protein